MADNNHSFFFPANKRISSSISRQGAIIKVKIRVLKDTNLFTPFVKACRLMQRMLEASFHRIWLSLQGLSQCEKYLSPGAEHSSWRSNFASSAPFAMPSRKLKKTRAKATPNAVSLTAARMHRPDIQEVRKIQSSSLNSPEKQCIVRWRRVLFR